MQVRPCDAGWAVVLFLCVCAVLMRVRLRGTG